MFSRIEAFFTPKNERPFTIGEEVFHSITHGIATGLSIAGLTILVVLAVLNGDVYKIISFSIFGASLVILYLSSTLYHGLQQPRAKKIFKIFDHSAIYLLIAGTYTPFLLVGLRGTTGWTLLVIVWGIALIGITFKIFFIERFQILSVISYLLMGWLCVFVFREMLVSIPIGGIIWLAAGGFLYTVGVIFYALQKIPYMHAIWHFFVLGGSICHYFAVLFFIAPI
ncbi:MAG: hemolysin III family protein [Chloroflexota bacterium]|nr:MAG: hemolysin III family protein [Chloroflexota bacterium]UCF29371.1 MAG: hemolysin III family protein [Chloroflexota bacterium]